MSEKITLLAENLFIIRTTMTWPNDSNKNDKKEVRYYETPSTWNTSPTAATIFQNYEAGEAHLNMYNRRDKAPKGWMDGRKEIIEVVPLYGEILLSPNAKKIEIRKPKNDI